MTTMRVVMSVAGSDSGGGAGIQADLRVMQRLGVFGTTAITAVTAQNLEGVSAVDGMTPELLRAQIEAVLGGFDVGAIKTGMLWSAALVEVVDECVQRTDAPLVIDPVMVATSGARLLNEDAVAAYRALFRRAALVTPNLDEAEVLLGRAPDHSSLADEAKALRDQLGAPVLLKGGHLDGDPIDVLAADDVHAWRHPRIATANTHGSGCMLSAAIACHLALGRPLVAAIASSLAFVHDALDRGTRRATSHDNENLADIEHAVADGAVLTRVR